MATGDRICPYCGQRPCICSRVLRKIVQATSLELNLPPEKDEYTGTKGKAIKPKWQVKLLGGRLSTVYAYNINCGQYGWSIVADGVKIEFDTLIIGIDEVT